MFGIRFVKFPPTTRVIPYSIVRHAFARFALLLIGLQTSPTLLRLDAAPIRISVELTIQDQPDALRDRDSARMEVEVDGPLWRIRQRRPQFESLDWNEDNTALSLTLRHSTDDESPLTAVVCAGPYPQLTSTFVTATWFAYCSGEYLSKHPTDVPDPYEPALTEPAAHVCQLRLETLPTGLPSRAWFVADPIRLSQARDHPLLQRESLNGHERKTRLVPIATLFPPHSLRTEYAVQQTTNISGLEIPLAWTLKKYSTRPPMPATEHISVLLKGVTNYQTSEITAHVSKIEPINALTEPTLPPHRRVSVTDFRASAFRAGFDSIPYMTGSLPFPKTNSQVFQDAFQRKLDATSTARPSPLAKKWALGIALSLAAISAAIWARKKQA